MQDNNDSDIEKIIRTTAREAVHETLIGLGFDAACPHDMQADLLHLRKLRRSSEFLAIRLRMALIATLLPAILYLVWDGVRQLFTPH